MKYPVVLVVSEGNETPENIIDNIRKIPNDTSTETLSTGTNASFLGYVYHLNTKYYTTDIFFVPFKDDLALVPPDILESTEGILIYFDAGKRNFSAKIPKYADFVEENNIELGILLCDSLYEDSNEGITYKEAKQKSKFLDVIELGRTRDEDEEENPHDPLGYDELLQVLRSFVWSNIELCAAGSESKPKDEETPEIQTDATNQNSSVSDESAIETELAAFENLISEVLMFKNTSPSWSRNERLACAEKLASQFELLVNESSSDDEEQIGK